MARISIMGLYQYDPTIFDGLEMPRKEDLRNKEYLVTGIKPLDKQLFIDHLCISLAEISLVYSDPDVVRYMISTWSRVNYDRFLSLWETLLYKYNPIWNKDGVILETRDLTFTDDEDTTGHVHSTGTSDGTVDDNVTGYDSNTYSPNTQTVQDIDTSSTADHSGTRDLLRRDTGTIERKETGNIGVTTTQEMLKAQRDIVDFNIYDYMTNEFKREFCVMVY